MLSIVAVLSGEEIFSNPFDPERKSDAITAHAKFQNKFSDHLTLLNVFKAFPKTEKVKMWCQENYLNARNLSYAVEVRRQLNDICERIGLESSSCGNDYDQVSNNFVHNTFILGKIKKQNSLSINRLFSNIQLITGTKMSIDWFVR